jgi:hypothetical protein
MPDPRTTTVSVEPREYLGEKTWLVEATTDHPSRTPYGGYAETVIFECSTNTLAENLASFIRDNDVHVWNVIDSDH